MVFHLSFLGTAEIFLFSLRKVLDGSKRPHARNRGHFCALIGMRVNAHLRVILVGCQMGLFGEVV